MNFELSVEVVEALGALDRMLAHRWDVLERARAPLDAVAVRNTWREVTALGLAGLTLPEAHGGFGGDGHALARTAQALGARHCHLPFTSTIACCATAISSFGSDAQRAEWLPGIAAGHAIWALAHVPGEAAGVQAVRTATGLELHGQARCVLDAPLAEMFLVHAECEGRPVLAAVSRGAASVRAYRTIDGRGAGEVTFAATPVGASSLLGGQERGGEALACAVASGCLALAGEAVGLMQALLALTQDYLRVRKQFGTPLARFQVLQHRAADMLVALEQTRSITLYAAHLRDTPEGARAAAAAKAYAGEAARAFAHSAVQLHGAMGMVDETPAAHFAKRLALLDAWLGSSAHHLAERIATDTETA